MELSSNLLFTNNVAQSLDEYIAGIRPANTFVITDTNTASFVLPRMKAESKAIARSEIITIEAGEHNKSLDQIATIWQRLSASGATRNSAVICLGGGMITDMGAFAASTFKRGIPFINIPTTLLAAVDASVGGKTGFNFNSLKNEIGLFRNAELVIISTTFFRTLPTSELLSGYAEMLKHAFLESKQEVGHLLGYPITNYDTDTLLTLLRQSVEVKQRFVAADPEDRGMRHALNFGHTVAHAFESLALQRKSPLSHGYAVAFGLIVALILSHMLEQFPSQELYRYASFVEKNYGVFALSCDDYPQLLSLMHHDKKNSSMADAVNFTLLSDYGQPKINVAVSDANITAALDIYRDLMHL